MTDYKITAVTGHWSFPSKISKIWAGVKAVHVLLVAAIQIVTHLHADLIISGSSGSIPIAHVHALVCIFTSMYHRSIVTSVVPLFLQCWRVSKSHIPATTSRSRGRLSNVCSHKDTPRLPSRSSTTPRPPPTSTSSLLSGRMGAMP